MKERHEGNLQTLLEEGAITLDPISFSDFVRYCDSAEQGEMLDEMGWSSREIIVDEALDHPMAIAIEITIDKKSALI